MAIQKEIWKSDLIGNYWRDNSFAKKAVVVGIEYIYGGKVVHIPKIGARPKVTRNRTNFPATVDIRADIDILYLIDEFFVDPLRIPNADMYELSYDKRQSILGEQSIAANQAAAEWLLFHWNTYTQTNNDGSTTSMKAHILRTTGSATAAHLADATGNRKALTVADFKRAKVWLNKNDVPGDNRYALLDSDMLDQVTQDPEYKKAERIYEHELVEGTVAKIQGFWVQERSLVSRYTSAVAPNPLNPDEVTSAGTNGAGLFWHTNGVESAIGDVEFFGDEGEPTYYSDIYSAILRAGGRIRRDDSVIAMVQDA